MAAMPSNGIIGIGSNAVTGIGTASPIHQMIIHDASATSRHASGVMPSGAGSINSTAVSTGPATSTISRCMVRGPPGADCRPSPCAGCGGVTLS